MTKVSVVGLGPMGSALAHTFLAGGNDTTVWNRTSSRADALAAAGADVAPDFASAVKTADLVVTCLRDHATTRDVLETLPHEDYADRTVVVLASATPEEARKTQAWADDRGIRLIVGAIMVPTPVIGTPGALILYSGRRELVDEHRATLEIMAARTEFVGADPGLAALLDTSMLEIFFAAMTAFVHAAAMLTGQGRSATEFVPWAKEMLEILPDTFEGLAGDVDAGTYPGTEDNLDMELAGLSHMVDTSRDFGLDSRLPELMRDLARQAVDQGYGADGWSRVVDVIRGR